MKILTKVSLERTLWTHHSMLGITKASMNDSAAEKRLQSGNMVRFKCGCNGFKDSEFGVQEDWEAIHAKLIIDVHHNGLLNIVLVGNADNVQV